MRRATRRRLAATALSIGGLLGAWRLLPNRDTSVLYHNVSDPLFTDVDTDGDGTIDESEYAAVTMPDEPFATVDADADGRLTPAELERAVLTTDPTALADHRKARLPPPQPARRVDLVVVRMAGDPPQEPDPEATVLAPIWSASSERDARERMLVTGRLSPSDNAPTLSAVLTAYGYHPGADAPRPRYVLDASTEAPSAVVARWRATPEPTLPQGEASRAAHLREDGDSALVLLWVDVERGAAWWYGAARPAPLPAGTVASTVDVVPTLLRAVGAVVPSDADGADLAAAPPTVAYARTPDGWLVRDDRHTLTVPEPTDTCVTNATLTDLAGRAVDDPPVRLRLCDRLARQRARLAATTATGRLGADERTHLDAAHGYWP